MKHTKGQWIFRKARTREGFTYAVFSLRPPATSKRIIDSVYSDKNPEVEANFRLIAQAPAMLEALKEAKQAIEWLEKFCPKKVHVLTTYKTAVCVPNRLQEIIAQAENRGGE